MPPVADRIHASATAGQPGPRRPWTTGALARSTTLLTVWRAWLASTLVVLVANAVVLAVPHARGLEFVRELRFAVLTPLCVIATIVAALGYGALRTSHPHPRRMLTIVLLGVSLILVGVLALGASPPLARASSPTVLIVALVLAGLVPRFVERSRRRVGTVLLAVLGIAEIVGVVAARGSEAVGQNATNGSAFTIDQRVFDVEQRFATLPSGARIHYVDEGVGPTLLFLHGNPAWLFQWHDLIGGLRDSYRCVALDYPGFGLSSAAPGFGFSPGEQSHLVEEFVAHLELRDVTLVMQDWGGPIGFGFAGRRPDLVRAVVLGNTWAWPTPTREPRGIFSKVVGGPIGEFLQMNFNAFARVTLADGIVRDLPADIRETYLRPFRTIDGRRVAAYYPGQITAATDFFRKVEAGLARLVTRPALVFWGMRDGGFPRSDLERFTQVFPNHWVVELSDADHFFFEDAAEQTVGEMRAFLAALKATSTPQR